MERSKEEVNKILDICSDAAEEGTAFPGMSYEDGVKYALEWMTCSDCPPPLKE